MSEWRVKLWQEQPDGKIHWYPVETRDGILAAAEALAHFASLHERPIIRFDSNLEVMLDDPDRPDQVFTVRAIVHYAEETPEVLAGLEHSQRDIQIIKDLGQELRRP